MKKTGAILRKAREEKGLSLHEIGLSLKINSKILRAIEEGDEATLPAKTFLRGFVQSYSNYLHLDTDKVLQAFYEEMGSTTPQPFIRDVSKERSVEATEDVATTVAQPQMATVEPIKETPKVEVKPEAPKAKTEVESKPSKAVDTDSGKNDGLQSLQDSKIKKSIGWFVVAALLFVLIVFTKKMIDKYSKEAEVPSAEVAQTMEGATPVISEPHDDDIGDAEVAQSSLPNSSEAPKESSAVSSQEPVLSSTNTSTPPKETPAAPVVAEVKKEEKPVAPPAPTPAVVTPAKPEPVAETPAKPEEKPAAPEHKPVELIVEALDAVEIEYASASGKSQKIKLSSEQVHTFKSRSGLKINFSNGGAVNLILNGRDVGIPGDLGKPIKLTY